MFFTPLLFRIPNETMRRKSPVVFFFLLLLFLGMTSAFAIRAHAAENKLRVGTFESPPFAFKDELGNWEGIAVDLWSAVATSLSLNYEWVEITREQAVEALVQGKVDVVAAGL